MPDHWVSHHYPTADEATRWFPDSLADREVIRIHHIATWIRYPTATSDIQRYGDIALTTRPLDVTKLAGVWPDDWVNEFGPDLLAVISVHMNQNYGEGSVTFAHEHHNFPFPVPRDCFGVQSSWYGAGENIYGAFSRINYEKVVLGEQDYELLLARSSWKLSSNFPLSTPLRANVY